MHYVVCFSQELAELQSYLDERERFARRTLGYEELETLDRQELEVNDSQEADELNGIISEGSFRNHRLRLDRELGKARQISAEADKGKLHVTSRREIELRKRLVELTQIAEQTAEGQTAPTKCFSSIGMALRKSGCDCDECFSVVWTVVRQDYDKSYDGRRKAVRELAKTLSRLAGPQTPP